MAVTKSGMGMLNLGCEDSGMRECRDVGLGEAGTWDTGMPGCGTRGHGMRGCDKQTTPEF